MIKPSELVGKSFKDGERTYLITKAKYTHLMGGIDEPIKKMVEVKTKCREVIVGAIDQFESLVSNHNEL